MTHNRCFVDRRTATAGLMFLLAQPLLASPRMNGCGDPAILAIEREHGGRLGVFALDTGGGQIFGHRADERFLMCSSFKGMLAACVLARVDAGLDGLNAPVAYRAEDLLPFSPVTLAHVTQSALSLETMCRAILTQSDNTAANLLLSRIGGPAALTAFARRIGDRTTRFDRTEPSLNEASGILDTTTPRATVRTLSTLYSGHVLKPRTLAVMESGMIGNLRGPSRLRGSLPRDWTVGDRTGTSDTMCNDYAFARRPGRAAIAMAAYYEAPSLVMSAQEDVLRKVGAAIARWANSNNHC